MDQQTMFLKTPPAKLFFMAALARRHRYACLGDLPAGGRHPGGPVLSSTAFAALNLAMPFVIINFALADLIGVGSSVPISIALGQGQDKKANNIFTCACLMIFGTGILVGAVMYAIAPVLIGLMAPRASLPRLQCSTCGCTPSARR